jgi:hypothetical protein
MEGMTRSIWAAISCAGGHGAPSIRFLIMTRGTASKKTVKRLKEKLAAKREEAKGLATASDPSFSPLEGQPSYGLDQMTVGQVGYECALFGDHRVRLKRTRGRRPLASLDPLPSLSWAAFTSHPRYQSPLLFQPRIEHDHSLEMGVVVTVTHGQM